MTDKPSRNEEEYFAQREAELLRTRQAAAAKARADEERMRHYLKCPKCGADLVSEDYGGIHADRCPECHGIWFDADEVQSLTQKEGAVMGLFKSLVRNVTRA